MTSKDGNSDHAPGVADLQDLIPARWRQRKNVLVRLAQIGAETGWVGVVFNDHRGGIGDTREFRSAAGQTPSAPPVQWGLSLCVAGTGLVRRWDGTEQPVVPGSLFQLCSATGHDGTVIAGPDFAECATYCSVASLPDLIAIGLLQPRSAVVTIPRPAELVVAMVAFAGEVVDPALPDPAILRRLLHLLDRAEDQVRSLLGSDDLVARARERLTVHVEPGYTMQGLAVELGVSYHTLRRRFKAATGQSPQAFQLEQRMLKACSILRHHPVKRAAAALGYSDPYTFSRQFKLVMGCSPSQYRAGRFTARDASG